MNPTSASNSVISGSVISGIAVRYKVILVPIQESRSTFPFPRWLVIEDDDLLLLILTASEYPHILRIELYLSGQFDHTMNGKNNLDGVVCDGIRLVCAPNSDYRTEIMEILTNHPDYFPYDYYTIRFSTFADEGYTGYKKKLRIALIDSTNMNSEWFIFFLSFPIASSSVFLVLLSDK